MKKLMIMAVMLAAGCVTALAQDYKYLTAAYNSVEKSFELATIQKITFEDGKVVITTSNGVTQLPQSEMEKMYFSATATAIESMALESDDLKMKDGTLNVNGKGLLHIYNSAGLLVQMANVDGQTNISLKNLPKGVYIVNLGKQTIKVSK